MKKKSENIIYWAIIHSTWGVMYLSSLAYESKMGLILSLIPGFGAFFIALKGWWDADD